MPNIKSVFIEKILGTLIPVLLSMLSPEELKAIADKGLDFLEDFATNSETSLDDKVILPICKMIRTTFDIPDND